MRGAWASVFLLAVGCGDVGEDSTSQIKIVGDRIPVALTSLVGDPERGRLIFTERESGHCVLCHQVDTLEAEFQGNLGPNLSRVGDRLTLEQLRLRVVDYQLIKPGAVMPSYYREDELYNVGAEYIGETFLSRQDIEDVIAYLAVQKG